MANLCPGIVVSEFMYANNFTLLIRLCPEYSHLIMDEPITIGEKEVIPAPSPTINDEPLDSSDGNSEIINSDVITHLTAQITLIEQTISDLKKSIEDNLNPDIDPEEDCDPNDYSDQDIDQDTETAKYTEFLSPEQNPYYITTEDVASGKDPIVIFCPDKDNEDGESTPKFVKEDLPIDGKDLLKIQLKTPLCEIPDSKVKSTVSDLEDITKYINDDTLSDLSDLDTLITNTQSKKLDLDPDNSEITAADYYNTYNETFEEKTTILQPKEVKLGIPLATLNKEEEIHLQIIDSKVEVTNLFQLTKGLKIDKELEPGVVYTIIFRTNGFSHSLYLYDENNNEFYSDSLSTIKDLTVTTIAMDALARKHFCGKILDVQIFANQIATPEEVVKEKALFTVPDGVLAFYDWNEIRVHKNLSFSLPSFEYPLKMFPNYYNNFILEENTLPYKSLKHGYITNFFCNQILSENEFTIAAWFKIEDDSNIYNERGFPDYRGIIDDDIHGTTLMYDRYTNKFKLQILSKEGSFEDQFFDYYLRDNSWYFITFKLKRKDTETPEDKIIFRIHDEENNIDEIEFKVPENFKFILMTMFAQFVGRNYTNFFDVKIGNVALFKSVISEGQEDAIFYDGIKVLKNRKM